MGTEIPGDMGRQLLVPLTWKRFRGKESADPDLVLGAFQI